VETFCPIKKHGQLNVIGGANKEPHYPRVKRVVKSKPWTPWVMADHYKRRRRSTIRITTLQPKKP
jgi:hypothetical protein